MSRIATFVVAAGITSDIATTNNHVHDTPDLNMHADEQTTPKPATPHNTPATTSSPQLESPEKFTAISLEDKELKKLSINEAFFGALNRGNKWKKFLPIVITLVMDVVIPVALYFILKAYLQPVWALLIAGAPALLTVILKGIIKRQVDFIGLLVFIAFGISAAIAVVTGDPRILIFEKSIVTAVMGVIFLLTLIPMRIRAHKRGCSICKRGFQLKPFLFYILKQMLPLGTIQIGEDVVEGDEIGNKYDWLYEQIREFRKFIFVTTLLWGIGFFIEFIGRLAMVLSPLSLDEVVLYANIFFVVVIVILILSTVLYLIYAKKYIQNELEGWLHDNHYSFHITEGDALETTVYLCYLAFILRTVGQVTQPEEAEMSSTCDPRLSWSGCSHQDIYPIRVLSYAASIWSTVTIITLLSHRVLTLQRKGWMNETLMTLLLLSGFILSIHSYLFTWTEGTLSLGTAELLGSLPVAVSVAAQCAGLTFYLNSYSRSEKEDVTKGRGNLGLIFGVKSHDVGIDLIVKQALPVVSSVISSIALSQGLISNFTSYLLSHGFSALFSLSFISYLYIVTLGRLQKSDDSHKRKTSFQLTNIIFSQVLWINAVVIHATLYRLLLSSASISGWLFVTAAEFLAFSWSLTVTSSALCDIESEEKVREKVDACVAGRCPPIEVDEKKMRELHRPIWENVPKSVSQLFETQNPINQWEYRASATITGLVDVTALLMGAIFPSINVWYLYAFVAYGYISRLLFGSRFDLQEWIVQYFIRPFLPQPVYVSGYPKRWGNGSCSMLAVLSLFSYLNGDHNTARLVLSGLLIGNICQSIHQGQICWACSSWYLLVNSGFVSREVKDASEADFVIQKKQK
ncbi:hypothetical protein PROFUN_09133 [Planoprotostelium fungivorum]|uniref:DUF4395 domain-containing protein n=1 Tax=Planoprotostelium fungivorum TaxID=1890364 RepID=A0A2P6NI13_9EUKA|nr:hypothetical protein PROFUN_09133 [Planoprotostelium fungivorum]